MKTLLIRLLGELKSISLCIMKKIVLSIISLLIVNVQVNAQNAFGSVEIHDTRNINEPPGFVFLNFRLDFKSRTTIEAPGSGGYHHQLNFNDGGLFWRTGNTDTQTWNAWQKILVENNGKVGIGTSTPQNTLDVNGTIRAKEIKVETNWADFVFNKNYTLRSIGEVNEYIKTNNHLPDIPTEAEVKENGVNLGEMQTKLLQKIEELTLYLIRQQEEINALKNEVKQLKYK
jgi:hypothetical protein